MDRSVGTASPPRDSPRSGSSPPPTPWTRPRSPPPRRRGGAIERVWRRSAGRGRSATTRSSSTSRGSRRRSARTSRSRRSRSSGGPARRGFSCDGAMRPALEALARERGVADAVIFLGAIYDEPSIAPWATTAACLVHPGAIGLSIFHAFGYGLPVITSDRREIQMPEFETHRDGENGLLARHGDAADLAARIESLLADEPRRRRCPTRRSRRSRDRGVGTSRAWSRASSRRSTSRRNDTASRGTEGGATRGSGETPPRRRPNAPLLRTPTRNGR